MPPTGDPWDDDRLEEAEMSPRAHLPPPPVPPSADRDDLARVGPYSSFLSAKNLLEPSDLRLRADGPAVDQAGSHAAGPAASAVAGDDDDTDTDRGDDPTASHALPARLEDHTSAGSSSSRVSRVVGSPSGSSPSAVSDGSTEGQAVIFISDEDDVGQGSGSGGPSARRVTPPGLPSGPSADGPGGRRSPSLGYASPPAVAGPSRVFSPLFGSPTESSSSSATVTGGEDPPVVVPPAGPTARNLWFGTLPNGSRGQAASQGSDLGRSFASHGRDHAEASVAGPSSAGPRAGAHVPESSSAIASRGSVLASIGADSTDAFQVSQAMPAALPASQESAASSSSAKNKGKGKEKAAWLSEDDLSCAICQDIYVGSSSVVPCGHTFCGQCIWDYVKADNSTCPICRAEMPRTGTVIMPNYALEEVICRWADATLDESDKKEWVSRKDGWLAYKLALEDEGRLNAARLASGRPGPARPGGGANLGNLLAEYAPNLYDRPGRDAARGYEDMLRERTDALRNRMAEMAEMRQRRGEFRDLVAEGPRVPDEPPRRAPRRRVSFDAAGSSDEDDPDYRPPAPPAGPSMYFRRSDRADFSALPSRRARSPPLPLRPVPTTIGPADRRPRPVTVRRRMFDPPSPPPPPPRAQAQVEDRPVLDLPRPRALSPRSRRRRAVFGSSPPAASLAAVATALPAAGPSNNRRSAADIVAGWRAGVLPAAGGVGGGDARARPVVPLPARRRVASAREIDIVDLISDSD